MDEIDLKLLGLIQRDASLTVKQLSAEVGLSANACWRRLQQYEQSGLILKRVTLLDPAKFGVGLTVFVNVQVPDHSDEWISNFKKVISGVPEVEQFYRMAGDIGYVIKLRVMDLTHYDRIYRWVFVKLKLTHVSASFALEEIKNSTELKFLDPLDYYSPGATGD